jgi:hypothetical protein
MGVVACDGPILAFERMGTVIPDGMSDLQGSGTWRRPPTTPTTMAAWFQQFVEGGAVRG